jgi:hypothetical protein
VIGFCWFDLVLYEETVMVLNTLKFIVLSAIFLTLVLMASTGHSNAADLGRYDENQYEERYDRRDRGAEVVLRGMEIIAGAIASRNRDRYYYPVPPPIYYYDPYQTYYYDPYGAYAVGPNRYYGYGHHHHHRHRHHHHHRHHRH